MIAMLVRRRGILRRHHIQPRRFRVQLGDQVCGVDLGNKYPLSRPAYSKGNTQGYGRVRLNLVRQGRGSRVLGIRRSALSEVASLIQ